MKKGSGDSVAAQLLKAKGFSADGHTSTLLDRSIVKESDMILVMEGLHQKIITEQYPESAGKIRFLKSFARDFKDQDQDIRDCYHRSIYHYRLCFSEIYLSIKGLLQCI
jgi:protein-tyrosine-phosphatase